MLDRVQKRLPLEKEQYGLLRKLGVVEGKAPNVYVSINVADIIDERPQYTKNRAMDNQYYEDLIIKYLRQFGSGKKSDFIELLSNKLSEVLNDKQKDKKVGNLLTAMSGKGLIKYDDKNKRTGAWVLT